MRAMRSLRGPGAVHVRLLTSRSDKLVSVGWMPRQEATDERWLERGLPAELHLIAQRAGRHRSHLLYRVDVDEDRDSIAHHQPCEHSLSAGRIALSARGPGDRALYAPPAGAFDPPLADAAAHQEGSRRGRNRPLHGLAAALHEKASVPEGRRSLSERRSR